MTSMVHKYCGGIIAESVDPNFRAIPGMLVQCKDFYLAGTKTHPDRGSPIMCPKCNKQVGVREVSFPDETEDSDCLE